ncbi:MAG: ribonuclease G [Geobacteraceae bacterium GWC2_55_20]|nr:MAG: ribonuclease G [Geobacteraceae bacterium GWC2_55_20]OGU20994.1 MAG: ribonuclease G [Geobacteraceae bacterium GWF2_54_21]HBA73554.1 Rne/Rng family ribonuclease [Geobacter sp.]HCE69619.1 Rne/Rng family ribonuclease [Geobacter sp.]
MGAELVINAASHETRIALIENGTIAELYIERSREKGIVGNIYKGRVIRVLPGMQAAFVDIGLEKAAFLYVADVFDAIEEYESLLDSGNKKDDESRDEQEPGGHPEFRPLHPIEDLLQEGQELLVQISKEPLGTKGARITSHISLPGRHLVYMPTVDHIGISRRIEDEEERERLREVVERLKQPGSGYIVRTVSEGKSEEDLIADIQYLSTLWNEISTRKDKAAVPSLLHSDLDVVQKVVRDIVTEQVDRIVVDSKTDYDRIVQFISTFAAKMKYAIELYDEEEPIFDHYGLEVEISRALGRKVWLKSGGYIIIEQTEALTAIDVNTGRFVGKHNLEDTILKTNLEAVKEIAYQLRLRNIGGIIIIDFIDMEKEVNREKVFGALEEALKADKSKTNILKISELGLVEMTRKRVRESIGRMMCEPCTYCEGRGYIKSKTTICHEIFRELRREMLDIRGTKATVTVHPLVADLLYDEERRGLEELEKKFKKRITVRAKPGFHQEQFEILIN